MSLGVGVVVVSVGAFAAFSALRSDKQPTARYETAEVTRGPLRSWVTATGTVSPRVTVQVGSQVSGRIQALHADYNATVKKGQVIARIDPSLLEAEVAKARANLTVARAGVITAQANLAQKKLNHERTSALAAKDLLAKAERDTTLAALQSAEADLVSAQARLAQSRAALEQTETNLGYTTIISPIDGIVISRNVDVGQTVAASLQAPTLFTIAEDLRKMEVHTNVAESDVGRLQPGQAVEFSVDAFPGERFPGTVKEVRYSPTTVQNVVTYDAVVSVENSQLKLRPGMTADVSFLTEEVGDAIVVPNAALRFRPSAEVIAQFPDPRGSGAGGRRARQGGADAAAAPGANVASAAAGRERASTRGGAEPAGGEGRRSGRVVWTLGPDGNPRPAPVKTGISDGRTTAVLEGLAEGDRVIVGTVGEQPAATNKTRANGPPRPPGFL